VRVYRGKDIKFTVFDFESRKEGIETDETEWHLEVSTNQDGYVECNLHDCNCVDDESNVDHEVSFCCHGHAPQLGNKEEGYYYSQYFLKRDDLDKNLHDDESFVIECEFLVDVRGWTVWYPK